MHLTWARLQRLAQMNGGSVDDAGIVFVQVKFPKYTPSVEELPEKFGGKLATYWVEENGIMRKAARWIVPWREIVPSGIAQ